MLLQDLDGTESVLLTILNCAAKLLKLSGTILTAKFYFSGTILAKKMQQKIELSKFLMKNFIGWGGVEWPIFAMCL